MIASFHWAFCCWLVVALRSPSAVALTRSPFVVVVLQLVVVSFGVRSCWWPWRFQTVVGVPVVASVLPSWHWHTALGWLPCLVDVSLGWVLPRRSCRIRTVSC